ncbi:MAG: mandelate racemase/muconate lactonizing enzyme family protein [Saprospiraceae bacterium]|nr:mandelate racemase/muconate lactonizing enzyme family protein [Saprospiraceae bacterium]
MKISKENQEKECSSKKDRRSFLKRSSLLLASASIGQRSISPFALSERSSDKPITIRKVDSQFEREQLRRPFGFKGGHITGVWQPVAYVESENEKVGIGLGTQSVLWCDARVFAKHSEQGGNALMYAVTERALQMLDGETINHPIEWQEQILDELHEYAKDITRQKDLRKTFSLNPLVPVDNALWILYAMENNLTNFDQLIPERLSGGLSARHDKVASIPALGYGTSMDEIRRLAEEEFFIMKIKIGAPGDQAEMLEKDKNFIKNIHDTIGHYETGHTKDGKIPYYFDANGRYQKKETLHRFLDYADSIGALEQIAVIEEPFGEHNSESVLDLCERGVRVAADESAHTDKDALLRIEQGYNAIAVKAVAKTLSMTMKIAQIAYEHQVPCFCADLTVNPILVDWNKIVAACLPAFPELDFGLLETNGWQNYRHWDKMSQKHPMAGAPWTKAIRGVFNTNQDFFEASGGILQISEYYASLFNKL